MSLGTLEPPVVEAPVIPNNGPLKCPHCKKRSHPKMDTTQPPRLQGAKCPHCKLFVPGRIVSAALEADE